MSEHSGFKVLALVGDAALATLVNRALMHESLRVTVVFGERQIVPALSQQPFDLVLVGGVFERRGPMILCEVVRERQPGVPVLVLHGEETDDERLKNHRARKLVGVDYLDIRGPATDQARGAQIREQVLHLANLPEDFSTIAWWELPPPALTQPPPAPPPPPMPPPMPKSAASEFDDGPTRVAMIPAEIAAMAAQAAAASEPPALEPVTDEDLEFAIKLARQARSADVRNPPAKTPVPEGVDRTAYKLRERVREVEWQLARLSHVYAARVDEFDRLEVEQQQTMVRLKALDDEVLALRTKLQAQELSAAQALKEATEAHGSYREQNARLQSEQLDRQQELERLKVEHAAVLETWQQRLGHIKDEILTLKTTANAQAAELAARDAEVANLTGQLQAQKAALTQAAEAREARETARFDVLTNALAALEQSQTTLASLVQQVTQANPTAVLTPQVEALAATLTDHGNQLGAMVHNLDALTVAANRNEMGQLRLELHEVAERLHGSIQALLERAPAEVAPAVVPITPTPAALIPGELERLEAAIERLGSLAVLEPRVPEMPASPSVATTSDVGEFDNAKTAAFLIPTAAAAPASDSPAPLPAVASPPEPASASQGPQPVAGWLTQERMIAGLFGAAVMLVVVLGVLVAAGHFASTPVPPTTSAAKVSVPAASPVEPPAAVPAEGAPAGVTPVVEPTPGEGSVAAPAPETTVVTATAPVAAKDDADAKKNLRRVVAEAVKKKKWSEAADRGLELQALGPMDWEASLWLAQALLKAKRLPEAVTAYEAFIAGFADNKYLPDARYELAGALVSLGRKDEAKTELGRVVASTSNKKLKANAEQALKELTAN